MSGAAARLGLTQPALSRQVRSLEHILGVPLLARDARGATPTHAGRILAGHCALILATAGRLGDEVRRVARDDSRRCVLGCATTPIAQRISTDAARECATADQPIEVAISDISSALLPAALLEARCDVGVGHRLLGAPEEETRLSRELLIEEAIECALVSPTHPLAGRREIRPPELGELPLIFIPRSLSPTLYDRVVEEFARVGYAPKIVTGEGMQTRWALAREGLGWCLGFRSHRLAPPSGLAPLRLTGVSIEFDLEMIMRSDESRATVLEVAAAVRRHGAVERAALAVIMASPAGHR
jgi:DNA-binding transcriptional LysR family regulator